MEHKTEIVGRSHPGILSIYLKMIGLILLSFSIGYWTKLVGIADPALSFETMPYSWQASMAALVILQPIAALGLWGNTKWGVVVWIIVILIELIMFGIDPGMFSAPTRLAVFHVSSFLLYIALALLLIYANSKMASLSDQV